MDERDDDRVTGVAGSEDEVWRPRRGPLVKVVTWGILIFMAAVVVAMVVILVGSALR
ncbi:MAG: hypothetical protein WD009_02735 [Phycisphaeraceae bacterium]